MSEESKDRDSLAREFEGLSVELLLEKVQSYLMGAEIDSVRAWEALSRAQKIEPDNDSIYYYQAVCLMQQGDYGLKTLDIIKCAQNMTKNAPYRRAVVDHLAAQYFIGKGAHSVALKYLEPLAARISHDADELKKYPGEELSKGMAVLCHTAECYHALEIGEAALDVINHAEKLSNILGYKGTDVAIIKARILMEETPGKAVSYLTAMNRLVASVPGVSVEDKVDIMMVLAEAHMAYAHGKPYAQTRTREERKDMALKCARDAVRLAGHATEVTGDNALEWQARLLLYDIENTYHTPNSSSRNMAWPTYRAPDRDRFIAGKRPSQEPGPSGP